MFRTLACEAWVARILPHKTPLNFPPREAFSSTSLEFEASEFAGDREVETMPAARLTMWLLLPRTPVRRTPQSLHRTAQEALWGECS